MPELAEVAYYGKKWDPGVNQTVTRVHTHDSARVFREFPAHKFQKLKGKRFKQHYHHGKQLLFQFEPNTWVGIHLGMTGKLTTAALEIVPAKSEHLIIFLDNVALVFSDYRMFGKCSIYDSEGFPEWWQSLPDALLSRKFSFTTFNQILERRNKTTLKGLLLDQKCFPGLGNWMVDEILWKARIHPADSAQWLNEEARRNLFDAIKKVSRTAMKTIGVDWTDPPSNWLFHKRWRDGNSCPKTGELLVREEIAGRTTCYSPIWQPSRKT